MAARTKIAVLFALALVATGGAAVVLRDEWVPERSPAHRGRLLATRAGCVGCHGLTPGPQANNATVAPEGATSSADARTLTFDPDAPRIHVMVEGNPVDARKWIEKGSPPRGPEDEIDAIVMPGYAGRLTPAEIDDLVAFVVLEGDGRTARRRAAAAATPTAVSSASDATAAPAPAPAYAPGSLAWPALMARGERLARGLGCFGCHGELGQGGIENVGSLKGYIPGFFGRDFDALTRKGDRSWITAWIVDGAPREFLDQGVLGWKPARHFLEKQATGMPAYAAFLMPGEADLLTDYLLALRAEGPLGVEGLVNLRGRMNPKEPPR